MNRRTLLGSVAGALVSLATAPVATARDADPFEATDVDEYDVLRVQQRHDMPFIAPEHVADALDTDKHTARKMLEQLERDGTLASKQTGDVRIWFVEIHDGGETLAEARQWPDYRYP